MTRTEAEDPDTNQDINKIVGRQVAEFERDLPTEVTRRLSASRRQAVAGMDVRSRFESWLNWPAWSVAGASMACLVLIVVLLIPRSGPVSDLTPPSLVKLPAIEATGELVIAQELELLEDLEFVAWMVALEDEISTSG